MTINTITQRPYRRSPQTVAIYAAGFSLVDVAKAAGLALGTVRNICAGGIRSHAGRRKIEAATGLSLWPQKKNFKL